MGYLKTERGISLVFALGLLMIVTLLISSYIIWYERHYRYQDSVQLIYQRMANDLLNKDKMREVKEEQ